MLSAAELARMRIDANLALPDSAVIQNPTFASDAGGGGSITWTTQGTVSCRLAPLSGSEREIADRVSTEADSIVTLPQTAALTERSRLVISGGTFNVAAIRDRSWEITQRVEVVKEI